MDDKQNEPRDKGYDNVIKKISENIRDFPFSHNDGLF